MSRDVMFDRWYAAKQVKFLLMPSHRLETFGNTLVNYHLISELDDYPGKVRVREGRLEAHPPRVIVPDMNALELEGFGPEAREYVEFLRKNSENLRILRYGYKLRTDNFSEQVLTDSPEAVADRVLSEVKASGSGFDAVLRGVDDPWDIALVELWMREVDKSAPANIRDLDERGAFSK